MWEVGVMPQTIEECDRRLRENFEGATVIRNGVVLVRGGKVVDMEAWRERVRKVFDRREEYYSRCRLNYTRENSGKK